MNKEVEMLKGVNNLADVVIEGVDMKDYPDFCDAYIESAEWADTGLPLTEDELDNLNENESEYIQEKAHESIHG